MQLTEEQTMIRDMARTFAATALAALRGSPPRSIATPTSRITSQSGRAMPGGGPLRFAGGVGTGFTDDTLALLQRELASRATESMRYVGRTMELEAQGLAHGPAAALLERETARVIDQHRVWHAP